MPKPAPSKKSSGGAGEDDIDYNEVLRTNYKKACAATGVPAAPAIVKALNGGDDPAAPLTTLTVDAPVGAEACLALLAAILARGAGMKQVPYKHLTTLRLLGAGCGDAIGPAIADILCCDGLRLEAVELVDCGLGIEACRILGQALMLGANFHLKLLRLDLNRGIGDEGCALLCRGLSTNQTLQRLSMTYCGLGSASASILSTAVLSSPYCALQSVGLQGNRVGPLGLQALAAAARTSKTLAELVLTDNAIGLLSLPGLALGDVTAAGLPAVVGGTASRGVPAVAAVELPQIHEGEWDAASSEPSLHVAEAVASKAAEAAAASVATSSPSSSSRRSFSASSSTTLRNGGDKSSDGSGDDGNELASSPGRSPRLRATSLDDSNAEDVTDPAAIDSDVTATPGSGSNVPAVVAATPLAAALQTLAGALADQACPLNSIHLDMNFIKSEDISVLLPVLQPSNAKVKVCRVDISLPHEVFKALTRAETTTAKSKKKAGSAKKK